MIPSSIRLVRIARKAAGLAIKPLLFADYLLAGKSSNFSVSKRLEIGNHLEDKLIVFFVHFDKRNFIDDIDVEAINFLQENGYQVKVITNNCNLRSTSFDPIYAKNLGRDLGVYRDIVQALLESGYKGKVILLNNSIAWKPNAKFLHSMNYLARNSGANSISTLIESFQPRRHYQSFAFGLDFKSDAIPILFSSIKNVKLKRTLIAFGELKIGKIALREGLIIQSMISYENVISEFNSGNSKNGNRVQIQKLVHLQIPLNPTQHFWSEIISLGFPGFKKNLLTSNPANLSHLPINFKDFT